MKYLFKLIRLILTPPILFIDWITTPRGIRRDPAAQQAIDEQTRHLALYHFRACPFCIKVRRHLKRLSLNVELRNAQRAGRWREELEREGGRVQVPCLQIRDADGKVEWLYESDAIIDWLDRRFGAADGKPATDEV